MTTDALSAFCAALPATACALTVRRLDTDETLRSDPDACQRLVPPAGSFQVPLLLMARETAVITSASTKLPFNAELYPAARLRHDVDATEAMREDCEWFFLELGFRVDVDRAAIFTRDWAYGNERIGGFEPPYWVSGDLLINADQQADFLGRLYEMDLPVEKAASDLVLDLMAESPGGPVIQRILSRTTALPTEPGRHLAWHVGTVARNERRAAFALWMETPAQAALQDIRARLQDLLRTI